MSQNMKRVLTIATVALCLSFLSLFPAFGEQALAEQTVAINYQYDDLGRLISITNDAYEVKYEYDDQGNRLSKRVVVSYVPPTCEGDLDGDNDVDGSDLAVFAIGNSGLSLAEFAANFGTICP